MIVELENISKGFGAQTVLENITVRVDDNSRIGLIGTNGAGKSTLLNIIVGDLEPDSGKLSRGAGKTFGFLRQNAGLVAENSVYSEMRRVFFRLDEMEKRMRQLEQSIARTLPESPEYKVISAEYSSVQTQYELGGGYEIGARIATVLNGMSFGEMDWETPINVLSGGERTRLAICKLLLEEPDILILDEPTNHLDFPTLIWLEEYLENYRGALLIVSHDRFFLDKVCTSIWETENHQLYTYKATYSQYLPLKEQLWEQQLKAYTRQQEEIATLKDYVARNIARASTTKMAQSRQNTLDRMELISRPKLPPKPPNIRFEVSRMPVSDVLICEDISLSVGKGDQRKYLFSGFDIHVKRGEKIALVGHNGIGKTSMLQALFSKLTVDGGKISWGRNTDVAYFEQGEGDMDPNKRVIDELWDAYPLDVENTIRTTLGNAGLRGEEVFKKVDHLSGGERARLKFAKLMLQKGNVIILDEPTNHLDLATKEVLDKALERYEGTLIVVSHDRYLLNKFPDRIIEVTETGEVIYVGKYNDYAARKKQEKQKEQDQREEQKALTEAAERSKERPDIGGVRTKEQRREAAERRQELAELEEKIPLEEGEIALLEEEITLPEVMADYLIMEEKCTQLEQRREELDKLMLRWAEIGESS